MNKHQRIGNKGLTLLEIIVVLGLMSIVTLTIYAFFDFGQRAYTMSSNQVEAQNDARLTILTSVDHFKYASEMQIISLTEMTADLSGSGTNYDYLYMKNGELRLSRFDSISNARTDNLLASGIDSTASFFESAGDDTLHFNVTAVSNQESFNIEKYVKLENFSAESSGASLNGLRNSVIRFKQKSYSELNASGSAGGITSVSINKSSIVLLYNESIDLEAKVKPSTANQEVEWTSSDETVATVSEDGVVTAKSKSGTTDIVARSVVDSKVYAIAVVTVSNVVYITNLYFDNPPETPMYIGDTFELKIKYEPSNATPILTWDALPANISGTISTDKMSANLKADTVGTNLTIKAETADGSSAEYKFDIRSLGPEYKNISHTTVNNKGTKYQVLEVLFDKKIDSETVRIDITNSATRINSTTFTEKSLIIMTKVGVDFIADENIKIIIGSDDGGFSELIIKKSNAANKWDLVSQNLRYIQ